VLNDKQIKSCLSRFDSGAYSRLQFLRAVSHSVGAHTESLRPTTAARTKTRTGRSLCQQRQLQGRRNPTAAAATTSDDCCKVCIVAPRAGFALHGAVRT